MIGLGPSVFLPRVESPFFCINLKLEAIKVEAKQTSCGLVLFSKIF